VTRRFVCTLVAAATVAAASACGDESGSVTTDAEQIVPSKRDYVIQADTICARQEQLIETEAEISLGINANDFRVLPSGEIVFKPGRRPSPQRIERFGTEVVLPALREQLADLRGLTPPTGDEATVAAIYDAAEQGVDELAADPAAFNDQGAVRRSLTTARQLGRRYGFLECGTYSGP
jgi:hypothetical protein